MKTILAVLTTYNAIAFLLAVVFIILVCVAYRKALRYYITELIAMFSNRDSFFSKKRLESGQAFQFAFIMTCFYLYKKIDSMDIWEFGYVLTTWLFIAGYTVAQIQKEKKDDKSTPPNEDKK